MSQVPIEVELLEKTARSVRQRYRKATSLEADLDIPGIALLPTVDDASLWLVPTMVRFLCLLLSDDPHLYFS
jgi:hypothetical protein